MAKNGGLITLDDLAQYRAIERRPLAGRYRDHAVYSSPPPVSTGAALIETLQILENYQPRPGATYATDADYPHHASSPGRCATRARGSPTRRCGTSASDRISIRRTRRRSSSGSIRRRPPAIAARPPADGPPERIGRGTTAFAVADAEGNMIAVTQTLEHLGRDLLRVRRPWLPLQQPPARSAAAARRAVSCRSRGRRPRASRRWCSRPRADRPARSARRVWRSAPPATPGFRRPSTTSS